MEGCKCQRGIEILVYLWLQKKINNNFPFFWLDCCGFFQSLFTYSSLYALSKSRIVLSHHSKYLYKIFERTALTLFCFHWISGKFSSFFSLSLMGPGSECIWELHPIKDNWNCTFLSNVSNPLNSPCLYINTTKKKKQHLLSRSLTTSITAPGNLVKNIFFPVFSFVFFFFIAHIINDLAGNVCSALFFKKKQFNRIFSQRFHKQQHFSESHFFNSSRIS